MILLPFFSDASGMPAVARGEHSSCHAHKPTCQSPGSADMLPASLLWPGVSHMLAPAAPLLLIGGHHVATPPLAEYDALRYIRDSENAVATAAARLGGGSVHQRVAPQLNPGVLRPPGQLRGDGRGAAPPLRQPAPEPRVANLLCGATPGFTLRPHDRTWFQSRLETKRRTTAMQEIYRPAVPRFYPQVPEAAHRPNLSPAHLHTPPAPSSKRAPGAPARAHSAPAYRAAPAAPPAHAPAAPSHRGAPAAPSHRGAPAFRRSPPPASEAWRLGAKQQQRQADRVVVEDL